ncbi:MAG: hypothetical protein ACXV2A_04710, partial [Halobacteriota archaeon]
QGHRGIRSRGAAAHTTGGADRMTAQTGMAKMAKLQRHTVRPDLRTVLLVCATLVLIAIDLTHFTIATAAGAIVLAAFVLACLYFPRLREPKFAIYGFIIAQLSPISLQADLVTAVAYQVVCALFLTALIVPFPRFSGLGTYTKPAFFAMLTAAAVLALGAGLALWGGISNVQAASVSGAILLLTVLVLLRRTRDDTRITIAQEA